MIRAICAGYRSRSTRALASMAGRMLRTRWIVRAPIFLYKARLGMLLGSRLCMIEHVGRTTGKLRYVVLEIVEAPSPTSVIVASGFGTRSQWYRNVSANPRVRVWTRSRRPRAAHAHPVPAEQSASVLDGYAERHPRSWAALRPVFEDLLGSHIDSDGTTLPLVRLDMERA